MGKSRPTAAYIVTFLILIVGIIHLGVGIGIVAKYSRYHDIFRQSVGLAGYNIVIGFFSIAVGILGIVVIVRQHSGLSKIAALAAFILGVLALVSIIVGLVLNSQAIGYIKSRLSYRMNSYIEDQTSIDVIDDVQSKYECCGENLWLDWARSQLGSLPTGGGSSVIVNPGIGRRRRHQHLNMHSSPLFEAIRRRRQLSTGGIFTGLPSTYAINLPLSCCQGNGISTPNSLGGFCSISVSNSSSSFYVRGCMAPVANIVVIQITGIVLINGCLAILAFVFVGLMVKMHPAEFNPINKQPLSNELLQPQQNPNMGYYYNNNNNPNPGNYYNNNNPNPGNYYNNNNPNPGYYYNNNNPNPSDVYGTPQYAGYF
ncbi:unnamed protein product [Rotaria sordida]|uniref:Tetraspanin n=1 Tax=Rotaria sordida TaxID=392033 RepID=A0A814BJF2_9BILA|nr:unnamed protein product [Rotaria sordida]